VNKLDKVRDYIVNNLEVIRIENKPNCDLCGVDVKIKDKLSYGFIVIRISEFNKYVKEVKE